MKISIKERQGVYIRCGTTGKLFKTRRLSAKSKTFQSPVQDLVYDGDLVTQTEQEKQTRDCCTSGRYDLCTTGC